MRYDSDRFQAGGSQAAVRCAGVLDDPAEELPWSAGPAASSAVRPLCVRAAPAFYPLCARSAPALCPPCARSAPALCPLSVRPAPAHVPKAALSLRIALCTARAPRQPALTRRLGLWKLLGPLPFLHVLRCTRRLGACASLGRLPAWLTG